MVLEKLAIRIFRRPSIASLNTIPAAAVAWAPPTKIRIFCPSPKNRIDRYISRGQSPRYFSTRYQGRLKTRIAARQTRYDRFQTTFIMGLNKTPAAAVAWAPPTKIRIFCPSSQTKLTNIISRGQSPRYFSTHYRGRLKTQNCSHRMENALFRRPLQFLSHSPICYNPPLNFYLFRKNHELEMRHRRPAQRRQIHPL